MYPASQKRKTTVHSISLQMKGIFVFLAAIAFVCATTIEVTTAGPDLWNTINNAQPGDEVTNINGNFFLIFSRL